MPIVTLAFVVFLHMSHKYDAFIDAVGGPGIFRGKILIVADVIHHGLIFLVSHMQIF